jgi:hypothetical protein
MKKIIFTVSFLFFSIFLYANGDYENYMILPEFLDINESFQELGYTTEASVASFLKISVADLKAVTANASISEIIEKTPKTMGEVVISMSIACEILLSLAATFDQKTVNEMLNTMKTGNADEKEAYTNIMLTRRIMQAWGFPPYYSEPEQDFGIVT